MLEDVKRKRSYDSRHRSGQAEETRSTILTAAGTLFRERGWAGTTIAAIASAAMVSKETVYAIFGSKREILRTLVTGAVRGDRTDVALLDQEGPQALLRETDQRRQIARFAANIAEILDRVAPLIGVVRAAAEAEAEMAAMYAELHLGRRANLGFLADALLARGVLRLDRKAAIGTIWRLASPELYLLMRNVEGQSPKDYATWLSQSLSALLLAEDCAETRYPAK